MKRRQPSRSVSLRPDLEVLEARAVPAILVQLSPGGALTGIFGVPDGNVVVTQTAAGVFNVKEAANDLGNYRVDGDLRIDIGNSSVSLSHTLNLASYEFNNNVRITVGNSNLLTTLTVTGNPLGIIDGDLNITTGNGPDRVVITGVDVQGSVNVNTQGSSDTLNVGPGVNIDGNLTVVGAQNFTLVGDVDGLFQYDATREALADVVRLTANSSIGSIAVVNTGNLADVVTLDGAILDHAVVKLGNGNNVLNFDAANAKVLGNMTVVTGNNNDDLNFGAKVGGNLTILTNGGNDDVIFGNGTEVVGSFVNVQTGDGRDLLRIDDFFAPGARLLVFLGNGNDTLDLNVVPTLIYAFFDGGNGNDVCFGPPGGFFYPVAKRNF